MIHPERIRQTNDRPTQNGQYVLYWMQAAQRAVFNHALEYAARKANDLNQPLVAVFGLTDRYPEANERHYVFMLQGLREVEAALRKRDIQFVVIGESPEVAALRFSKDASMVITDVGYLKIQREWRRHLARNSMCPVTEVESDIIVPVSVASDREAYSAAILRRKMDAHRDDYLAPLKETTLKKDASKFRFDGLDLKDPLQVVKSLSLDRGVSPVETFHGGRKAAVKLLNEFTAEKLKHYDERRNDPAQDYGSHMSPYLHFGQISPLEIALKVRGSRVKAEKAKAAYLEELIVRRELSMNFVHYNTRYDDYRCLPDWAQQTLKAHGKDKREYTYALKDWEGANTHDPYWNAAQREMILTGKMHNYMRMYWGKKILEWSKTPQDAYQTALYLNNKYELDGRDPNGFAGVAWCFGKHDRPWAERPVFGKVRYMNANGLRRKFDIEAYVNRIDSLQEKASS